MPEEIKNILDGITAVGTVFEDGRPNEYSVTHKQLESLISQARIEAIEEFEEMIFQDIEIPADICKHIRGQLRTKRKI